MEQEEIDMWRMIDVGGYVNSIGIFGHYMDFIGEDIRKGDFGMIEEDWAPIRKRYEGMRTRYEGIDPDKLDSRFPKDIVAEVKNNIIPKLGADFAELEKLLDLGAEHGFFFILRDAITARISECKISVNEMLNRSVPFVNWPGYHEYRKLKPKRLYVFEHSTQEAPAV